MQRMSGLVQGFPGQMEAWLPLLLQPALEIQEVVCTLPKVVLYFELYKMPLPTTHLIRVALGHCVNTINLRNDPLMTGFSQHFKKKLLTLTL